MWDLACLVGCKGKSLLDYDISDTSLSWLLGSNAVWPAHGEIGKSQTASQRFRHLFSLRLATDIIEGVNENTNNQMTLHTSAGCFTRAGDCLGQNNAGCAIIDPTYGSFGLPFNQNGGGVFAAEWTANSIKIWFFPRTSPFLSNVLSNSPDPSLWGNASGDFEAGQGCVFEDHFKDLRIVRQQISVLYYCWSEYAYHLIGHQFDFLRRLGGKRLFQLQL